MMDTLFEINRMKTLTIFATNCQLLLDKSRSKRLVNSETQHVFLNAWNTFSKIHQSSPSRVNNNVTNSSRRRIESRKCSTGHQHQDENVGGNSGSLAWSSCVFYLLYIVINILESLFIFFVSVFCLYAIIVLHQPTQTFISRNTQDLIYPLMRSIRIATLPILRRFPAATDLYEESCLLSNPYFLNSNDVTYECWPCEAVLQVIELTGFSNFSSSYYQGGVPFIVKDAASTTEVHINPLEKMWAENPVFMSSVSLISNIPGVGRWNDLFPVGTKLLEKHENLHISWKINRVAETRLLRKYFKKPYFIPAKTEVSIQRFIFLDNFNAPAYFLPFTEFANVFLIQASGNRRVVLFPSARCQRNCKAVSVLLVRGDVVFYNWLYWHPKSVPVDSSGFFPRDKLSTTYLGSFY